MYTLYKLYTQYTLYILYTIYTLCTEYILQSACFFHTILDILLNISE